MECYQTFNFIQLAAIIDINNAVNLSRLNHQMMPVAIILRLKNTKVLSEKFKFKVLGEIMTMSEVADPRKHNDHLIMSFVIQAIVNIGKENHLIIFFIDVNTHASSFRLINVKQIAAVI